jgi:3-hydroxyacyl-[acyl-carrier-protein] dehydratase
VSNKDLIVDFSEYDLDHVVADIEDIRKYIPQRYEMEQLTAIVYDDPHRHICVGYKDLTEDEFWVRGHMPVGAIMPGVIMCEAAAQLCTYHVQKNGLMQADLIGYAGIEGVRFRDLVFPGDRFVIVAKLLQIRRTRMLVARFQGFVRQALVVDGTIKGMPLAVEAIQRAR